VRIERCVVAQAQPEARLGQLQRRAAQLAGQRFDDHQVAQALDLVGERAVAIRQLGEHLADLLLVLGKPKLAIKIESLPSVGQELLGNVGEQVTSQVGIKRTFQG
jgi:hypothetical protein